MSDDQKYKLNTLENRAFLADMGNELLNFGKNFPSKGGSAYYLHDDGTPWIEKNLETYETARMAHVYSIAAMKGIPYAADLADRALQGLCGELHDSQYDGWYAGITPDGTPVSAKQCYVHAFVILAASSALLAGRPGAKELLENAFKVYDRYFWNEAEGLSCDTWNRDFTVCDEYRGLNANMHTVEAFLGAADATGDEKYRIRAGRIIDRVLVWAGDHDWRIPEHYSSSWEPDLECNADKKDDQFKPYGATCGHAIEWARLITQWALSTYGNTERASKYIQDAENLYNGAIRDGWDSDGAEGIVYTVDWNGMPVVHDRMHWVLAEAINTSAVLCNVTGKEKYAADYEMFMRYLEAKVHDHIHGSWFHQLDLHNCVMDTVWPGKPDLYHAYQATLIPYSATAVSIAAAAHNS